MKTATRTDLYADITNRIVEQLEAGVRPWHQPWKNEHPAGGISRPLRFNQEPYHGINVIVLWLTAFDKQYVSPIWMTFQQAKELGGFVRKGEKGTSVVYANAIEKKETDVDTGEEKTERIPFLKSYTVFNVEQIESLPERYYAKPEKPLPLADRLDHAERFFAHTKADIRHGGNRAYYSPMNDSVQMPPFESFASRETYYSTLAHECTHWTKHESRLNRSFDAKRFGDEGYSMEELVAELGAAFVCVELGITPDVMPEHAAYLAAWLKVLKADNKAIFTAAAHAERAAEYLHTMQPKEPETPTEAPIQPTEPIEFQRMTEAFMKCDFLTARDNALQLQEAERVAALSPAAQQFVKTVLTRTIYPD